MAYGAGGGVGSSSYFYPAFILFLILILLVFGIPFFGGFFGA